MLALLLAAREQDLELFKSAYSMPLRVRLDRLGWERMLRHYGQSFRRQFGDYSLDDFECSFEGDEARGQVTIVFKGQPLPPLSVVREGEAWKLDQL